MQTILTPSIINSIGARADKCAGMNVSTLPMNREIALLFGDMFVAITDQRPNRDFKCIRCGHCCYQIAVIGVDVNEAKAGVEAIPNDGDQTKKPLVINKVPKVIDGREVMACPHLDIETKGCTIYDKRPEVCRNFNCLGQHWQLEGFWKVFSWCVNNWNKLTMAARLSAVVQWPKDVRHKLSRAPSNLLDWMSIPTRKTLANLDPRIRELVTGKLSAELFVRLYDREGKRAKMLFEKRTA